MTRKQAVDKLLADLRWPESWRDNAARLLSLKTDNAATMDGETYKAVLEYIRSMR